MGSEHRTDEVRRAEFAHTCIALIRGYPVVEDVKFDAATFSLVIRERGGNLTSKLKLSNCYALYNGADPASRAEILKQCVRPTSSSSSSSISPSEFRASLRPLIQNRFRLEVESLFARVHNPELPPQDSATRPLHADLVIGLSQQTQYHVMTLTGGILGRYALDGTAAHEIALRNFKRDHGELTLESDGDLYVSQRRDTFNAARILLLPQWLKAQGWNSLVACVPSHDLLLVANPESEKGLWQMLDCVNQVKMSGRELLSAQPLTLNRKGGWIPFSSNVTLARMFEAIHARQMLDYYALQKSALEALFKGLRPQYAVSDLSMKRVGEQWVTVTSWTKEPYLLIPKADFVSFVDSTSGRKHLAHWRKMLGIMHGRLERTDWQPELYQVTGFPTLEELQRMKAESDPLDA